MATNLENLGKNFEHQGTILKSRFYNLVNFVELNKIEIKLTFPITHLKGNTFLD